MQCRMRNSLKVRCLGGMSSAAKDHKEEFLKYLELHDKAEDANDSLEVARFALQAVNEIHLVMPG
jgi:hypothetical protein